MLRFIKLTITSQYNYIVLGVFYLTFYILHWVFVSPEVNQAVAMIFHLVLLLSIINAWFFFKSQSSMLEKKHIFKDKDTNLIG